MQTGCVCWDKEQQHIHSSASDSNKDHINTEDATTVTHTCSRSRLSDTQTNNPKSSDQNLMAGDVLKLSFSGKRADGWNVPQ